MPDSSSFDPSVLLDWFVKGAAAIFLALTTAIGTLWKQNETKNAAAIAKQDEKHKEEIAKLETKHSEEIQKIENRLVDSERRHQECEEGRLQLHTDVATLRADFDSLRNNGNRIA